jgi:hypothetical protein
MSLDVVASVEIARPPEVVAAFQFEPENDPAWIGGVTTAERLTSGPMAVGSRVRRRGGFLGRPIEWVMDVEELITGRRLAMHAVKSPFPMDVTYELDSSARGTLARIRIRGDARGPYALLGPLTPWLVRRSVTRDLRRLRKVLEAG